MCRIRVLSSPAVVLLVALLILPSALGLPVFGSVERLTFNIGQDVSPFLVTGPDGKPWLFWESEKLGNTDIYSKSFDGTLWSPDAQLTTFAGADTSPSAVTLLNGTLILFWVRNEGGNLELYRRSFAKGVWGVETRFTQYLDFDTNPSAVSTMDGGLWVFWVRRQSANYDLFYRRLQNGLWGAEVQLTSDPGLDIEPYALRAKDGRIWVFWSSFRNGRDYDLYYKIFDGLGWTPDTGFTTDNRWDNNPSITQDRNGTLWLVWSRTFATQDPLTPFQDDILYRLSTDNGLSWSPEALLVSNPPGTIADDFQPAIAQMKDRRLWLVWVSDRLDSGTDYDLYLVKTDIILTHDIRPSAISASPNKVNLGFSANITVTVENLGDYPETFEVTVFAGSTKTGSTTITGLAPGGRSNVTFPWKTTESGRLSLSATVTPVPGETVGNKGDNMLKEGVICVVAPGDFDKDCDVDILDAARLAIAFGSKPGDSNWNPDVDLNGDGVVNILDAAILAFYFS